MLPGVKFQVHMRSKSIPNHHWAYFKNLPLQDRMSAWSGACDEEARDALESEKDTIALGVLLLVDVDGAINHGDNTISEL